MDPAVRAGATGDQAAPVPASPSAAITQVSPSVATNAVRSFSARGVVMELPPGGDTVVVRHEAIPGFMPKMTMTFNVRGADALRGLTPGDAITFRVKATEEESWIEEIKRGSAAGLDQSTNAGPSAPALLRAGQVKVGEVLPDAPLLTEAGDTIHLSDFRGRALALTFIFTRCPLPDFCPRMNRNFDRARDLLLRQAAGPTNWQFLSISFDSEFDRGEVLQRYAQGYRGAQSDRWLFAVASADVLGALGPEVGFRFSQEGGSFVHNLRTVVLDPQRRVYRQFEGNQWKAAELAQALTEAAALPASK